MMLLYIMFVDEGQCETGSSVRPNQMLKAFKNLDIDLKIISGKGNNLKSRKKNAVKLLQWLNTHRPDFCYIEPPSGPIFCYYDLKVLRKLRKMNIPISLFYRDAYWLFPELFPVSKLWHNKIKLYIIKKMQLHDLKTFRRCCDHIFFPSVKMANFFNFKSFSALPPGCSLFPCNESQSHVNKNIICVGGATERYGIYLLLDSMKILNDQNKKVNLTLICPKEQWDNLPEIYQAYEKNEWLNVKHINGIDKLRKEYEKADIAVIPILKNEYNDFAMPIKLFEYLSFLKPIVSTDCQALSNFIKTERIGIVVKANVEAFSNGIWELTSNDNLYAELKINCIKARKLHTWDMRAKTVLDTLSQIQLLKNKT